MLFVSAHKAGRFASELAPIEVKGKKGMEQFSADEHPRETTLEKLGSLKAVFKENGTVTAGNASVRKKSLRFGSVVTQQKGRERGRRGGEERGGREERGSEGDRERERGKGRKERGREREGE